MNRQDLQHRLVTDYRERIFDKEGIRLDWNETYIRWIKEGYAKKYAEIYKPEYNYNQLEKLVYWKDKSKTT